VKTIRIIWQADADSSRRGPFQNVTFLPRKLTTAEVQFSSNSSDSIFNVKVLAACFITFRLKDTEKNIRNINPF
jgi:hypothetical protein